MLQQLHSKINPPKSTSNESNNIKVMQNKLKPTEMSITFNLKN